jgi:HlyD family secretion protein
MTKRRTAIVGALVLAIVLVALVMRRGEAGVSVEAGTITRQAQFRSVVTGSGEIVASRYADIGAEVMGRVVELPVVEGQPVRAGQVLARIDPVAATSDAAGAAALVRALQAEERASADQVRAAESEVAAAEARHRDAAQQLTRKRELSEGRLISAAEYDSAANAAETAVAQVAVSRASLDRARQAHAAATARLAQSRAQQLRATDTLRKTSVVAPIDGIVTRLRVRAGEMVVVGIQNQPGTTLMTVSDLTALDAEVRVAEAEVLRVALSQPAEISLEAMPGTRFTGRVVEVGASALPAAAGAAARDFRVVVRLQSPDPALRPGLTCDADIVTNEQQNVLTAPLQAVVLRAPATGGEVRPGVFAITGDRVRFVPVTQGSIGGMDMEVTGINEGTVIVVGPFQALRELSDGARIRVSLPTS